jgi:hypothetical protein
MTTEIKYTVSIPAEDHDRVVALITWFDAAPSEAFGDRFYENVYDIMMDLTPTFSDEMVDCNVHYTNYPCLINGEVCVPVCSGDGSVVYYIRLMKETVDL